jgi:glycosyltransferase involved in cell wall biosynthesis
MPLDDLLRRPVHEPSPPAASSSDVSVLTLSHAHPRLSKGGAESAAYMLHEGLGARLGPSKAWFMGGRSGGGADRLGARISQPFGPGEFVYDASNFTWFNFANRDAEFPRAMQELLDEVDPHIVHFHHYALYGVEVLAGVKRNAPHRRVVLTLHEFLAICNHFGQMVTSGDLNLCHDASFAHCNRCFPEIAPSDFFLRKTYVQSFMSAVDAFVSPSRFLAERYIAWGLPSERVHVIENAVTPPQAAPTPLDADPARPLRIGFFGQISKLKGIHVLLDAAEALMQAERRDILFEVHGDNRNQPPEFQADFAKRRAAAGANVRFCGPYDASRVDGLMREVDAVLMPSVWWENSPVVIQEALRNRRPVICSDIGGMAEKVTPGVNGFHFPVGSAFGLMNLLERLADDRSVLAGLSAAMPPPTQAKDALDAHLRLYRSLLAG